MAPPTRTQILADVTSPTFDVEVWTGSAWVSVKAHVTSASARLDTTGGDASGIAMGPAVRPEADVELALAGWVQATDATPVRINFGFGSSDLLTRFGGIVAGRDADASGGRWQLRGWDAHIEAQEVRSPLFKRRPIATQSTLTSVEDPGLSTYRGGIINFILWTSGGRPYEQAASYPNALFYYRCTTAVLGPAFSWTPGDNPWTVALRLCQIAGGQLYQDGAGTVCYVDPITLATGTPGFTFTDEALGQTARIAANKAGYETIGVRIDSLAKVGTVTATFVSRLVQGEQPVYEDTIPRRLAPGASLTIPCDTKLPIWRLVGASVEAAAPRSGRQASASEVTVTATLPSSQRVSVVITNTLAEPVVVDVLRIVGCPLSAGEEQSASYTSGAGRTVSIDDSPYLQSERHAAMLCRMLADALANGGILYTLGGCSYDPDLLVGAVVGLTCSPLGLANLRCRVATIDTDGAWMDVVLAPLGTLPTRDSVHLVGAISGTKDLAY